jgi:hypothetical protein
MRRKEQHSAMLTRAEELLAANDESGQVTRGAELT